MRHVVNAPASLTVEFDTDPGVVTVEVVRDDGAAVTAGTVEGSSVRRTAVIAAADNDQLDRLTATWTSATLGQQTTFHDIVGGHYVSLYRIRESGSVSDSDPDARAEARDWAETLVDSYCETAFTPRYGRFSGFGRGTVGLLLPSRLRAIRWATVAGDDVDLADWTFESYGQVTSSSTLLTSDAVEVGYEYGWDAPPADIVDVALALSRFHLLDTKTRMFDRARAVQTDYGMEFLSTPDFERGRPSGLPGIDATLNRYRERVPTVA